MTQEPIQQPMTEKPNYADWMRGLKAKVETSSQEQEEEFQWRQRYGKT